MSFRTAMVVDDDLLFRRIRGRLLNDRGIQVTMANSCQDAVEALSEGLPDVLFVDLEMPGARGDRLVRPLRQV